MPRRIRAFSVVELLVVMSVIAVLLGIIIPMQIKAATRAKWVQCESNLRQVGVQMAIYASDNRGWVVPDRF